MAKDISWEVDWDLHWLQATWRLWGLWVGVCTAKREGGHCVGSRVSRQVSVGQHAMCAHETKTLIIQFGFVSLGHMVRRQHQGHLPRRHVLVGVCGGFVEIGISVGYTRRNLNVLADLLSSKTDVYFSSQSGHPSWCGAVTGMASGQEKGASKQLAVKPTRFHSQVTHTHLTQHQNGTCCTSLDDIYSTTKPICPGIFS